MASVEAGDAGPMASAIREDSSNGREEIAAFAISTQGLSVLMVRCRGSEALPAPLAEFLFTEGPRAGARARRLLETLVTTIRALRTAGVEVVALKGAALAFFHYPDPAWRPMGDLDLLLRDPGDLARTTEVLSGGGWRALFDTPRHRVFAREDERVSRPATEDPDNPIRVEIHTTFRLPVLGRAYDTDAALRQEAKVRVLEGTPVAIASGPAFLRHLLFHATGDFAGIGIRGVQAYDFRLLARARGALAPEISLNGGKGDAAPLWFATSAIERLFPDTFEEVFLSSLSSSTPPDLRRRAAALPALRYTRPPRGWTRTLLTLIEEPLP